MPPGVKAKQLFVDIAKNNIKFGITPNPPYMDVSLLTTLLVMFTYSTMPVFPSWLLIGP